MSVLVRPATPADIGEIRALIVELCVYEKEPASVVQASEADLHDLLFGARPAGEAVMAEVDGAIAGHALFYETFSTWEGRRGVWLEDLFVRPAYRSTGAGAALFTHLARLCVERGYGRYEWVALDWNDLALDFYKRWGAEPMDEWRMHRLSGDALLAAAREADVNV